MSLSLVLVAPHEALREGLALLLARAGCTVLGSTACPSTALALVERRRPDAALVDLDLGERDGLELARKVRAADPRSAVVVYAAGVGARLLHSALEIGVRGVALKDGTAAELLEVLESACAGVTCVDARLARRLLPERTAHLSVLSRREAEVVELLSHGLTGEQIAQRLVLSTETVKTHVRNAMVKLEASTRAHAIAIAMREGYISGPGELPASAPRTTVAA